MLVAEPSGTWAVDFYSHGPTDSDSDNSVVLLDELDHIASSTQGLTTLLTMVHENRSHIRLIGIANTHTLSTSSVTELAGKATMGIQAVHFAPYNAKQLLEIVRNRLAPLSESEHLTQEKADKFLPAPTLLLLTKKIAAMTGDVRACMEVLRGAIDIAVNSTTAENPFADSSAPVTPSHVLSALKAYAPAAVAPRPVTTSSSSTVPTRKVGDSETVSKVQTLSLQARLALAATLLARKRMDAGLTLSGSSSGITPPSTPRKRGHGNIVSTALDATHLHAYYKTVLSRANNSAVTAVSRSEFGDLLNMLETVGLITLSSTSASGSPSKALRRTASLSALLSKATAQEVRLVEGLRTDEVIRGLDIADGTTAVCEVDAREEEVKAVWEKERVRIAREAKARQASTTPLEAFAEAAED